MYNFTRADKAIIGISGAVGALSPIAVLIYGISRKKLDPNVAGLCTGMAFVASYFLTFAGLAVGSSIAHWRHKSGLENQTNQTQQQ